MNDSENLKAKKLVNSIFNDIIKSKSISDLEKILENNKIETKYWIKTNDYPKIEFNITNDEIKQLESESYINNNIFNHNKIGETENTIVKLLYAIAWKNGDLKKIRHIIEGIKDGNNENKKSALVFYQFGKFLSGNGEPIIDQHVLRAFSIYYSNKSKEPIIEVLNTITNKHKTLIKKYKEWLISDEINTELKLENDYTYHIDKILFAAGKTIKKEKK